MNKQNLLKRSICLLIAVFLLTIFCAVQHDCSHDDCPVCRTVSEWKLLIPAMAAMAAVMCLPAWVSSAMEADAWERGGSSLVALKVKLSD